MVGRKRRIRRIRRRFCRGLFGVKLSLVVWVREVGGD